MIVLKHLDRIEVIGRGTVYVVDCRGTGVTNAMLAKAQNENTPLYIDGQMWTLKTIESMGVWFPNEEPKAAGLLVKPWTQNSSKNLWENSPGYETQKVYYDPKQGLPDAIRSYVQERFSKKSTPLVLCGYAALNLCYNGDFELIHNPQLDGTTLTSNKLMYRPITSYHAHVYVQGFCVAVFVPIVKTDEEE